MACRALLLLLLAALACAQQPSTFTAHRLAQLDVTPAATEAGAAAPQHVGSQRAAMSLLDAVPLREALAAGEGEDALFGKVVVVGDYRELTAALVRDLTEQRGAGAVLVAVPGEAQQAALTAEQVAAWRAVESGLLQTEIPAPVYFAARDDMPAELFASRSGPLAQQNRLRLSASASQPSALTDPQLINIEAHLRTPTAATEEQQRQTIVIAAHYDTFSAVPGMTTGADSNGSGAVALLELARIFSKLYGVARVQPAFDLTFLLTAGGALNFAGARHWLEAVSEEAAAGIEFALCLDSVAGSAGDDLYLHVSKPPKEPAVQRLYDAFQNCSVVHKKVNVANPEVAWEHEQFALRHVLAATFSRAAAPAPLPLLRSHVFDSVRRANSSALVEAIAVAGEALAHHVFALADPSLRVLQGEYAPSAERVEFLLEIVAGLPRVAPYAAKGNNAAATLKKLLASSVSDAAEEQWKESSTSPRRVFYGPVSAQVSTFRCKPFFVDLAVLLVVLAYLVVLYAALRGPRAAVEQLRGALARRGKKTTGAAKKQQ
eukprot:TRINITY_DN7644_c0_g1_i1.p1 TRINITY_DN7644_c0_g1~~TRINITY_DN7644_c0_g1_i1.p1  ORF type:complete len:556 (-),score=199.38 TRINITY_DN7644_c0_g1_i1:59-1696(-)